MHILNLIKYFTFYLIQSSFSLRLASFFDSMGFCSGLSNFFFRLKIGKHMKKIFLEYLLTRWPFRIVSNHNKDNRSIAKTRQTLGKSIENIWSFLSLLIRNILNTKTLIHNLKQMKNLKILKNLFSRTSNWNSRKNPCMFK